MIQELRAGRRLKTGDIPPGLEKWALRGVRAYENPGALAA